MSNTDPTKKPKVNSVPASYRNPAVLFIYTAKSGKISWQRWRKVIIVLLFKCLIKVCLFSVTFLVW